MACYFLNNKKFSMESRHVLIGVDESHADSREAIFAGMSFLRWGKQFGDVATIFSVLSKTTVSEAMKKSLLEAYSKYGKEHDFDVRVDTALADKSGIAECFLHYSREKRVSLLALGGSQKPGSLGSVVEKLVKESFRHILIARRQPHPIRVGEPRTFLFACDGTPSNLSGFKELLTLISDRDVVHIVTLSRHFGDKDKAILGEAQALATEFGLSSERLKVEFVTKNTDSIGKQLVEVAIDRNPHVLCVVSSRASVKQLGSTTMFCVTHSPLTLLVIKSAFVE